MYNHHGIGIYEHPSPIVMFDVFQRTPCPDRLHDNAQHGFVIKEQFFFDQNISFGSPSYYVWRNYGNRANFRLPVFGRFTVLGSGESKKHKISMVSSSKLIYVN